MKKNTKIVLAFTMFLGIFWLSSSLGSVKISSAAQNACPFISPMAMQSRGDEVSALQKYLISKNYLSSDSVTGFYGQSTVNAVRAWQLTKNIEPEGYIGPKSRVALCSDWNNDPAVISYTNTQSSVGWKSFDSERYFYSLVYPSNWTVEEDFSEGIFFFVSPYDYSGVSHDATRVPSVYSYTDLNTCSNSDNSWQSSETLGYSSGYMVKTVCVSQGVGASGKASSRTMKLKLNASNRSEMDMVEKIAISLVLKPVSPVNVPNVPGTPSISVVTPTEGKDYPIGSKISVQFDYTNLKGKSADLYLYSPIEGNINRFTSRVKLEF